MSDLLDNLEKAENSKTKEPYKSRHKINLKRREWDNKKDETEEEKRARLESFERIKRKKCAMLIGYSGIDYFGMQRNPGMKTIEGDLFDAMWKHKWVSEEAFNQAQQALFQRAARTDKGVSALRQCCSLKLPDSIDLEALNRDLPEQIRVFAVKRVTKGFNSKDQCNARTYTYTTPTIAFADYNTEVDMTEYRVEPFKIDEFNNILANFVGTKNYHNFTTKKEYLDPSSKRYIMSFDCDKPFIGPNGVEFATMKIKGQSFMMHQIRKMIGLAIAVIRGHTTIDTIHKSFTLKRLDIPMAPGLGLVLDQVHYERYNLRYGEDGLHEPLTWATEEAAIKEFAEKYVYPNIFETEIKEHSMTKWLETLPLHTFDERQNENKCEVSNSN